MDKHGNFRFFLRLGFVLAFPGVLCAQTTRDRTLIVNGKTASTAVRQIDGRPYVDVQALAEATNGSVTIETNRIILTIPASDSSDASGHTPDESQQVLSRGFAAAAVADLAEMREWRGTIGAMITYGLAVSDAWAQDYHERVQEGLEQAKIAASTEADHNALQLLQNESDKLATWADTILAARKALNEPQTTDLNALQDDPSLAKIRGCGQFLNSMLVSGAFADDSSCH
jgi:hypothetical protein